MPLAKSRRLITGAAVALGLLTAGGATLAFTTSASARTPTDPITFSGSKLIFRGAPGHVNRLRIMKNAKPVAGQGPYGSSMYSYTMSDTVAIEEVGSNRCAYASADDTTYVRCTWTVEHGQDPGTIGDFRLGAENDTVQYSDLAEDAYENDRFDLGAGKDTYVSDATSDASRILGGPDADHIQVVNQIGDLSGIDGGTGNDTIFVGGKDARASGGEGKDFVGGGAGRQYLSGGPGNDRLVGDLGNDELFGGAGNDRIEGDEGQDRLHGGAGIDTMGGGAGNDRIWGDAGNDRLSGHLGNDRLYGGSGNDYLKGSKGNDYLSGGKGKDKLIDSIGKNVLKQ